MVSEQAQMGSVMMTRLFIVRHAEAKGNVDQVFHGWTDSQLTPKGHQQAMAVAKRLCGHNFHAILSSPLTRTKQTAEYILKEVKKQSKGPCEDKLIFLEDLKEIHGGDWEDVSFITLQQKYPQELLLWSEQPHLHRMPNGESMVEFEKRLIRVFSQILETYEGHDVCVVTHGTVLRTVLCYFKGCSMEKMRDIPWFENTAVTILENSEAGFELIGAGDDQHLPDDLKTLKHQVWNQSRKINHENNHEK